MRIKICEETAAKIVAALHAVNGRATAHVATGLADLIAAREYGENALATISLPKSERRGAVYVYQSGEVLPAAYKYAAATTTVFIERGGADWFLTRAIASALQPRQRPQRALRLTPYQDNFAVAVLRRAYNVLETVL